MLSYQLLNLYGGGGYFLDLGSYLSGTSCLATVICCTRTPYFDGYSSTKSCKKTIRLKGLVFRAFYTAIPSPVRVCLGITRESRREST
jgi:hypothetical protein